MEPTKADEKRMKQAYAKKFEAVSGPTADKKRLRQLCGDAATLAYWKVKPGTDPEKELEAFIRELDREFGLLDD